MGYWAKVRGSGARIEEWELLWRNRSEDGVMGTRLEIRDKNKSKNEGKWQQRE